MSDREPGPFDPSQLIGKTVMITFAGGDTSAHLTVTNWSPESGTIGAQNRLNDFVIVLSQVRSFQILG